MKLYDPFDLVIFVVAVWLVVMWLISRLGGWAELAKTYRATEPFHGTVWKYQSAQLRWRINYNHPLSIGANSAGMYISVFPLLRLGHPALFIPWPDVSVRRAKYLWLNIYEFRFRNASTIPFRVREQLGKKLAAAAGNEWPGNREASNASL